MMSSTAVLKAPEESDESSDDSQWIVSNDAPLTGWTDPETWLDTKDDHLDVVSEAGIVVPASRRRTRPQKSPWRKVEFNIKYGSGFPRPRVEASDAELLW